MMEMLGKLRNVVEVLEEAWLVSRVPSNEPIFKNLSMLSDAAVGTLGRRGFHRYLDDHPAIGRIIVEENWFYHKASGEMRLIYSNSLFAPGCLRLRPAKHDGSVIVFFPGYYKGADDVLGKGNGAQNMKAVAEELGTALACWDWPLQGRRRDRCLYQGLRSVRSSEREYSRIFPALGTSLWREIVNEIEFALGQIRRHLGPDQAIHVVGWSMGGCFAYLAPLLETDITTTVAAGSCARIKDLLAEGKSRLHGYFFYPLNGLAYFDLEDVVDNVLEMGRPLQIICGDRDAGCLESTRSVLIERAAQLGHQLKIDVLPGHGHFFSPLIKDRILRFLRSHHLQSSQRYPKPSHLTLSPPRRGQGEGV